jgi:hypothetical protein
MLRDMLGAAAESAMPIDPRVWLEHPPHSSYPARRAVKAADAQNSGVAFLRRAREGLMCERFSADRHARAMRILGGELWEPV